MAVREKNLCGKMRKLEDPYETWRGYGTCQGWEWRVLKKYQTPSKEKENPYARWYCAVKSPYTFGSWEYGDTYVKDIVNYAIKDKDKDKDRKFQEGLDKYNEELGPVVQSELDEDWDTRGSEPGAQEVQER